MELKKKLKKKSAELEEQKNINQEWSLMVQDWVQTDVGEVTVLTAKNIVKSWQEREVSYIDQIDKLQNSEKELQSKQTLETASRQILETDEAIEQEEQDMKNEATNDDFHDSDITCDITKVLWRDKPMKIGSSVYLLSDKYVTSISDMREPSSKKLCKVFLNITTV